MNEAVILSAVRTPIGKFLGALSPLTAPELGTVVVAEAVKRSGVRPEVVDEVILGNVLQAGVGQAPARQAALKAGLPPTVAAVTVNKVCGSGLKAVMLAAQTVRLGDAQVVVAGGMESMSNAPHLLRRGRSGWKIGDQAVIDAMLHDGLLCSFSGVHMGDYADATALQDGVSRADQDAYAAESQRRAAEAIRQGYFRDEIVAVTVPKVASPVAQDEGPRAETTVESLAKLKPAFGPQGTVTAGNASTISDGAAALVIGSREKVEQHGHKPLARIVGYTTAGGEPRDVFTVPALAITQLLTKLNLTVDDIDLFEVNEAFAAQMLATGRRAKLPFDRVNVHGGAIALGHPIGASGARVLVTLLHAMKQRKARRGMAALCLGGGNAVAMVVESL